MKKNTTTSLCTALFAVIFVCINVTFAQTNPTAQTLATNQNFGTTTFTTIPTGFAVWTVNSSPIGSQTNAQNSTTNGDANITAATAAQTTGGAYGYATSSNARVYFQTSSNSTNGTNQLACAINTTGWTSVLINYDIEAISMNPRTIGAVLQYRIGTSGSWTTISGTTYSHTSADRSNGAVDNFTNIALPSGANNNAVVQLRWAIWRGSETGNSSGIAIDNISITATSTQTAYYFRSKQTGNFNDVNSWEASADNSTWNNATITPTSAANTITIRNGHHITITASEAIDQTIVDAGATLTYADVTGSTPTINNGSSTDLIINGTFEDLGPNSVIWSSGAKWTLGSNATILRTRSTSANNWRDNYDSGINNIPATATWIVRKVNGENPNFSSTGNMYYPNLIVENATINTTWSTASAPGFSGSTSAPIIKGSFNIGGNGAGNVSFINENTATSPVIVNGDLTIKTNSTLRSYGTGIEVQGNITLNGSIDYGANTPKLVFSGSNNQTVTGAFTFNNVELNKSSSSATVTINSPATVTGAFTFTSGKLITTATNLLTFNNGATVTGASNNSYIDGPCKKIGNTAFTFPTGKNGNYQPIGISAPTVITDAFTGEYFATGQTLGTTLTPSIINLSTCEYWQLNRISGTSIVGLTLGWNANSCNSTNPDDMNIANWNGSIWKDLGNTLSTGNSSMGSIRNVIGVYLFGTFTLSQKDPLALGSGMGLFCNYTDNYNTTTHYECDTKGAIAPYTYIVKACNQIITICPGTALVFEHNPNNSDNIDSPGYYIEGQTYHYIYGSGLSYYEWDVQGSDQQALGVANIPNSLYSPITCTYNNAGTYSAVLRLMFHSDTDGNEYILNGSKLTVIVLPSTAVSIGVTQSTTCVNNNICVGVAATGNYSIDWADGSINNSSCHSYNNAGTYLITVSTSDACGQATATSSVTINNIPSFDTHPSGTTTWSGLSKKINGVIEVNNNETFTINNTTIEFAENSGILVKSGGTLNITNGSILKGLTLCNTMWNGIVVDGNVTYIDAGTGYTLNRDAGICAINTGSTLQDAIIGIEAKAGAFYANGSTTGYIQADYTNFTNNEIGIKMDAHNYSHSTGLGNSHINDCQFLCNAPLLNLGSGTTNFIDLTNLRNGLTINNNYFNGNTTFDIYSRGLGIYSNNAGFSADGNHFNNLSNGIYANQNELVKTMSINANFFNAIPFGVSVVNRILDEITANTFTAIPSADPFQYQEHTYGIKMLSSNAFMIQGNHFSGLPSTTPLIKGSHGIAFDNTGADGGVCFDNDFSGTDYGIHTQNNNQQLVIRCNRFSHDGAHTPHNASGLYVYSGALRQQGNNSCGTDPAEAAGNRWENTTKSDDHDVFTNTNFIYFANPADENFDFTTIPFRSSAINSFWTNLQTTNNPCISPTSGTPGCVNPDKGRAHSSAGNQQRLVTTDSLAFNKQYEINSLVRQYLQNNDFTSIETLLTESVTAESKKLLSQYYLAFKNYAASRTTLTDVMSATATDGAYQDSTLAVLNTIENTHFCAYMNVMIDLDEAGKTIAELNSAQLNTLHDIANAHVKISTAAETALTIALGEYYTHPIEKGVAEQSRAVHKNTVQNQINTARLYPNPNNGNMELEYTFSSTEIGVFILYDIAGREIAKYELKADAHLLSISETTLNNGIYFYKVVSDNKIIATNKIIIIK